MPLIPGEAGKFLKFDADLGCKVRERPCLKKKNVVRIKNDFIFCCWNFRVLPIQELSII